MGAASVEEILNRAQGLVRREDLSQITENTKGPGVHPSMIGKAVIRGQMSASRLH